MWYHGEVVATRERAGGEHLLGMDPRRQQRRVPRAAEGGRCAPLAMGGRMAHPRPPRRPPHLPALGQRGQERRLPLAGEHLPIRRSGNRFAARMGRQQAIRPISGSGHRVAAGMGRQLVRVRGGGQRVDGDGEEFHGVGPVR